MSALEVKDVEGVTTGTLPQVAVSVAAGDCDAGFIVDSFYDVVVPKSGLVDMGLLTKFWTSDPFPSTALVSGDRVSAEQVTALGKKLNELGNKPALIEAGICADQESCMFLSSSTWGLVAGDDAYYDVVRDLCAVLELDSCK
jgi:phosphonate transport system substrate-binding protein